MGYYFECPACTKVHPVEKAGPPLLWFDVDRVDPAYAQRLLNGEQPPAIPVVGDGRRIIGSVRNPLEEVDRACDDCGQDGCVDCILGEVCNACEAKRRDLDEEDSADYDYED